MKYELKEISVREVVEGYIDSAEEGCFGYGGKLNIRPPYQREFIYSGKRREAVIQSVQKSLPLGAMYWIRKNDGTFELLDGQQRTISICQYVNNEYSIDYFSFRNLTEGDKNQILDYKLWVCVCEGTDKETLEWFKVLNTPGTELNAQELRNAILPGTWLNAAKKCFSKNNGEVIVKDYKKYLKGSANRQDFLEAALRWICDKQGKKIEQYMAEHQHETNCNELWLYFSHVMEWVKVTFKVYRPSMKGQEWGIFYNKYEGINYDADEMEKRIQDLIDDEDITNTRGIYEYLFDGKEQHLSIRQFSGKIREAVYNRQGKTCAKCGRHFELKDMQADHIKPWSRGGRTVAENCQILCADCNRTKSDV